MSTNIANDATLAAITVSEQAKNFILSVLETEKHPAGTFVRVGVDGGGCSGLEYKLKFDTEQVETDQVCIDQGIKIVVDMKSLLYLMGTQLDYSGGLGGKGLYFRNPNATKTCSCGESFAV